MRDFVKEEQKRAIGAVRKALRWDVQISREGQHGQWNAYSVRSFPSQRRHEICLPPNGGGLPYDRLSELHEYVHALLAETVHPLFGIFNVGTPTELVGTPQVRGIINEAVDWFVHGWICTRYPIAFRERFARNKTFLDPDTVQSALARDPDPLFGMATFAEMAADLRRFAKWDGRTGHPIVDSMTEEFLATDCNNPSVEALFELVNRLVPSELDLAVVPICKDGNDPFWFVCRPSDLVPSEQPSGLPSSLLAS